VASLAWLLERLRARKMKLHLNEDRQVVVSHQGGLTHGLKLDLIEHRLALIELLEEELADRLKTSAPGPGSVLDEYDAMEHPHDDTE